MKEPPYPRPFEPLSAHPRSPMLGLPSSLSLAARPALSVLPRSPARPRPLILSLCVWRASLVGAVARPHAPSSTDPRVPPVSPVPLTAHSRVLCARRGLRATSHTEPATTPAHGHLKPQEPHSLPSSLTCTSVEPPAQSRVHARKEPPPFTAILSMLPYRC
jgi:hypothetical protein